MNILCHRGMWESPEEKNSLGALARAIDNGLGIETDVRDCDGSLVISHDLPAKGNAIQLVELFSYYSRSKSSSFLALNIKSDGLQDQLLKAIQEYEIKNYFVFDMSVPDTLSYIKRGMPTAARLSEYEQEGKLLEMAEFVWLDAFDSEWFSIEFINQLLAKGKKIAIVSPELHRRPHSQLWSSLQPFVGNTNIYLCTDYINEAMEMFYVQKN